MSTAFSRTLRSLQADSFRRTALGLALAVVLVGVWAAWSLLGRITLYEITDNARIEVDRAIYPLQSPVLGRVVFTQLVIGRQVQAGDLLVEVDAQPQQLQVREERTRLQALGPELNALRERLAAEEQARRDEQQAARVAGEGARAQQREAEATARFAQEEARRLAKMREGGLVPERDFERSQAEAQKYVAAAESYAIAVRRLEQEQRTRESDREAKLKSLQGESTRLQGQMTTLQASLARLEYEIERRRIRSPVAGVVAEAAILRVGAVVQEGEKLGAVVPEGRLAVVAQFPPPAALGRIRPGQKAKVRLHGFPWTQYGTLATTVARVAGEVREGTVRVELAVDSHQSTPIPLGHGLPGTVEVTVERISPAALAVRHAGRWLTAPRSAFSAEAGR